MAEASAARAEPHLDTPPAAGVPDAAAIRLAVCPYCRTVWELDPIFRDPVKLMICWRCAEQRAVLELAGPSAAVASQPPPRRWSWVDWKHAAGYAMLVALGLASGYVASQLRFEKSARAPGAAGVVSVTPVESKAAMRDGAAGGPTTRDPPAAGLTRGAAVAPDAAAADIVPVAPSAGPAPAVSTRSTMATTKELPAACTTGATVLGLCSAGDGEGRP